MLIVADINTLWRSRPFEALAQLTPVLGLAPQDRLTALRSHEFPWGSVCSRRGRMDALRVVLPMRWASRCADTALPLLWKAAEKAVDDLGEVVRALVVTSPHYLPLCRKVRPTLPVFYYCSDDYRRYTGWDAERMTHFERELVLMAAHSFFVSEELRSRAVSEYDVAVSATSVSMNATEELFLKEVSAERLEALMASEPRLKRPIVGVVGGINDRLDFDLLAQVSRLPALGTLLFIGTAAPESRAAVEAIRLNSTKVILVGPQPHDTLPAWQQLLDVALIPYRTSEFNRYCSPMRLFDHLAAGRPIVATSACPQVRFFRPEVTVADHTPFVTAVAHALSEKQPHRSVGVRARHETWGSRALKIHSLIRGAIAARS